MQQDPQPTPHPTDLAGMLRNPYGLALVVYYAVMAVVGMLIPDDILQSHAWAREFSDFMASIVPQIDRITALNIKPDVNRFYFSVLWAGGPGLVVIVCLMLLDAKRRNVARVWETPFMKTVLPMAFAFLAVLALWHVNWLVDPSSKLSKSYFNSHLGRAFLAQLFVFGPIFFGVGVSAWAAGWITGYIPRNIEKHKEVSIPE